MINHKIHRDCASQSATLKRRLGLPVRTLMFTGLLLRSVAYRFHPSKAVAAGQHEE